MSEVSRMLDSKRLNKGKDHRKSLLSIKTEKLLSQEFFSGDMQNFFDKPTRLEVETM
jgi:hypothetical protein